MPAKKLLFLGADTSTEDAIRHAKSIGIYTIVTDYNPKEKMPAKQLADEAWMIDVANTDAIEKRCREEAVTAVFAGNHEFCLDQCKTLADRLGLPFYGNNDGWKATRNKAFFKKVCQECGTNVPPWILLTENTGLDEISKLEFPIIVKPTDSCAQQGLSVVRDPADLMPAYKKALAFSGDHEVIAEEYIDGDELLIFTYVHRGKLFLLGVIELFKTEINGRQNFAFGPDFGRYNQYVKERIMPGLQRIVQRLGCKEGACLFQSIYRKGVMYNIELGYRLDGVRTWRRHRRIYKTDELELMVDLALGIVDEKKILALSEPRDDNTPGTAYVLWAKPGTIKRITGLQELYARPDIIIQVDKFKEGDTVTLQDNMRSIAYCLTVYADSQSGLDEKIKEINRNLHMYDEQGNDMLIYLNDYYETWSARMAKGLETK